MAFQPSPDRLAGVEKLRFGKTIHCDLMANAPLRTHWTAGKIMQILFSSQLRKARKERGLTLEQLAKKVGCSKSYISQMENDAAKPSVTMLGKLSEALHWQVTDFFYDEIHNNKDTNTSSNGRSRITKMNCLVPANERRVIEYPDGKTRSQFLTRAVYQKKMQPILTIIEPGGQSNADDQMMHPEGSQEFIMVLKGEIVFKADGQQFILSKGDTFYFDGDIPHHWVKVSEEVAEVVFVWTPAVW